MLDIAYLKCIQDMIVTAPMNGNELRHLLYTALDYNNGPFAIRYPRGAGVMLDWKSPFKELQIGSGRKINDGEKIAILSLGHPGNFVLEAQKELAYQKLATQIDDLSNLILSKLLGAFN